MEGKTIKQIADEIGVSKQAVYKKIKREPLSTSLQGLSTTIDGKLTVSVDGENLIKSAFSVENRQPVVDNQPSTADNQPSTKPSTDDAILAVLQATIDTLREQLKVKDEQLAAKDKQIDFLQGALNTSQTLHAGTIKKELDARTAPETIEVVQNKQEPETVEPDGKRKLIDRWRAFWA